MRSRRTGRWVGPCLERARTPPSPTGANRRGRRHAGAGTARSQSRGGWACGAPAIASVCEFFPAARSTVTPGVVDAPALVLVAAHVRRGTDHQVVVLEQHRRFALEVVLGLRVFEHLGEQQRIDAEVPILLPDAEEHQPHSRDAPTAQRAAGRFGLRPSRRTTSIEVSAPSSGRDQRREPLPARRST